MDKKLLGLALGGFGAGFGDRPGYAFRLLVKPRPPRKASASTNAAWLGAMALIQSQQRKRGLR